MMHSFDGPSLMRRLVAAGAFVALTVPTVYAQQATPLPEALPMTSAPASEQQLPQLNLQASASMELSQDTVLITLSTEINADKQADASAQLNSVLAEAVRRTEGVPNIHVQTSGYSVWPVTNSKGKIQSWLARGEVILTSKDFAAASALASKLADKVGISQISFAISREALDAAESALLKDAARAFSDRAQAAALAFGHQSYQVQRLELTGGGPGMSFPRPMMTKGSMSSASGYADAPLQSGEVTVTLSVSGTIVLH